MLLQGRSEVPSPDQTLVQILHQRALEQPDQVAFTFLADGELDETHISYKQLDQQSRAVAALLQTRASVEERVLLLFPAGLEYISAFFGCLYAGCIAVPAYPPRRNRPAPRIQAIAADAQPSIVLTNDS